MRVMEEKTLKIFLVIINIITVMKLVKDCFRIQEFNYVTVGLSIIIGVIIYLFFSICLNNKKKGAIFIFLIFVLIALIIYRDGGAFILEKIKIISNNLKNINTAALNNKEISFQEFALLFYLGIPLITAILLGITQKLIYTPLVFTGTIFIGFWYLIFYKMVINNIPYFIALAVFNLGIGEFQRKITEYRGREIKANLKFSQVIIVTSLLSLIITMIVLVFPQEYKGKTIEGISSYFKNEFAEGSKDTDPIAEALSGSYSMRQSGYSDSSSLLGGSIRINKKEVFKVKADKPYYLKGKAMDYYTGKSWVKLEENVEQKTSSNEYLNVPMHKLINELNGDVSNNIQVKTLTITPDKNFKTTSYFTPSSSYNVDSDNEKLYVNDIPAFFTDKEITEPYIISYLSYGDFDNYLEGIENYLYMYVNVPKDENYELPMRYFGTSDDEYRGSLSTLIDKSQSMEEINIESAALNRFINDYSNYLQLDAPIAEEVFKVVENILENEAKKKNKTLEELTNNDKALAIRSYLKENYKYVTNVRSANKYSDFVSNFILEEKEGYCTYFASATVIMCRIAGVPARYAQGFKMNDDMDSEGSYIVTNANAHAWAEILVNPLRDQWAIVDSASTPTEYEQSLIDETTDESTPINNSQSSGKEVAKPDKNDPGYDTDESGSAKKNIFVEYIGIFVTVSVVFLLIIAFIVIYQVKRMRIIKSTSVIPLYNYFLQRLKTIGIKKDVSLGDLEFVETIKDKNLKERLSKIVNHVYDEFYGGIAYDYTEKQEDIRYIEEYIKSKEKWYNYIMEKYFLLRKWRNK